MRIRYKSFPWVRPTADSIIKDFLIANGKPHRYSKDEIVVPTHYTYPYFSLVMSGLLAKGFNVIDNSKDFSHSIILPGSTVGDFYLMTNSICNLKIIAIRETILLEVPHDIVYAKMSSDMQFMKAMLNQLMLNTASDSEGLAALSARSSEERLKVLLKILIIRCNVKPLNEWYKLPISLSHKEYSRIVYTTPLTVNRLCVNFNKLGLMKKEGNNKYVHRNLFDGIYDWLPDDPTIQL